MKALNYSVVRGICAVLMGVLLVTWPEAAIVYLVIAIGAMFFVPSLFSLIGYFTKVRQEGAMFPIVGIGSLLFGLWQFHLGDQIFYRLLWWVRRLGQCLMELYRMDHMSLAWPA